MQVFLFWFGFLHKKTPPACFFFPTKNMQINSFTISAPKVQVVQSLPYLCNRGENPADFLICSVPKNPVLEWNRENSRIILTSTFIVFTQLGLCCLLPLPLSGRKEAKLGHCVLLVHQIGASRLSHLPGTKTRSNFLLTPFSTKSGYIIVSKVKHFCNIDLDRSSLGGYRPEWKTIYFSPSFSSCKEQFLYSDGSNDEEHGWVIYATPTSS